MINSPINLYTSVSNIYGPAINPYLDIHIGHFGRQEENIQTTTSLIRNLSFRCPKEFLERSDRSELRPHPIE